MRKRKRWIRIVALLLVLVMTSGSVFGENLILGPGLQRDPGMEDVLAWEEALPSEALLSEEPNELLLEEVTELLPEELNGLLPEEVTEYPSEEFAPEEVSLEEVPLEEVLLIEEEVLEDPAVSLEEEVGEEVLTEEVPEEILLIEPLTSEPWLESAESDFEINERGELTAYKGSDEHVIIPEGVISIGYAAFTQQEQLRQVTFPKSLTSIGHSAFFGCTNLESVTITEGVTDIQGSAFGSCHSLKNVELPSSIVELGTSVFQDCTSLEAISLPDGLGIVNMHMFHGCENLKEVHLPEHATLIHDAVFQECHSLEEIDIPDSVEIISGYAFFSCTSLRSVHLPRNLTAIGSCAFQHCEALEEIDFPEGLTRIDSWAFYGAGLKELTLPQSLTTINKRTFSDCPSLTRLNFPDTLTTIGSQAFLGCEALEDFDVPPSLVIIEGDAFMSCRSLTSLTFQEGLQSIGSQAFLDCTGLTKLYLPESLTSIGASWTFSRCDDLTLYVYEGSYAEEYAIRHKIPYEHIQSLSLVAKVSSSEGELLREGFDVLWYEDQTGEYLGSGLRLANVLTGATYRCTLTLDEKLALRYQLPAAGRATMGSESQEISITLLPWERMRLHGNILDEEGNPLPGSKITVKQTYHGTYENTLIAWSDENGFFTLEADKVPSSLTVSAEGFYPGSRSLDGKEEGDEVSIDFTLKGLSRNIISIEASMRNAVRWDEEATYRQVLDLSGLDLSIYNESQGRAVEGFYLQYPGLYLEEGEVRAYDRLILSLQDPQGRLTAWDAYLTLDKNACGSVSWTLLQNGSLALEGLAGSEEATLMLFDQAKNCIETAIVGRSYRSRELPAGTYTLILMKKSPLLRGATSLEAFRSFGLTSGTDYLTETVTITDGYVTVLSHLQVPDFDETKLYATKKEATSFVAKSTTVVSGQFVTMKATYEMLPGIESSQEQIQIELPPGLSFVEESLTIDGMPGSYVASEGVLTIPMNQRKGTIRFYVIPSVVGQQLCHASLIFRQGGQEKTQPLGTVSLQVEAAKIEVPSQTDQKQVTVQGKAFRGSEITVYDNEVEVGRTVSNSVGTWKLTFDLESPRKYSYHKIYAVVENPGYGIRMQTSTAELFYNRNHTTPSKLTMINYAHEEQRCVFDFLTGIASQPYYEYNPSYPVFTFLVEFTGESIEGLEDVSVVTTDSLGTRNYVPCVYDASRKVWVGSADFSALYPYMPSHFGISYNGIFSSLYETSLEPQDKKAQYSQTMELTEAIGDELEEYLNVEILSATEDSLSYDIYISGRRIGNTLVELLDYATFNLDEWTETFYVCYQDEEGTLFYETTYEMDNQKVTLTAYPDEQLLARETLTLDAGEVEKVALLLGESMVELLGEGFQIDPDKLYNWTESLDRIYKNAKEGAEIIAGIEEMTEAYALYKTMDTNVQILNMDLDTLDQILQNKQYCECVDLSDLKAELDGRRAEVGGYTGRVIGVLAGTALLTAVLTRVGGSVANKAGQFIMKKGGGAALNKLKNFTVKKAKELSGKYHKTVMKYAGRVENISEDDVIDMAGEKVVADIVDYIGNILNVVDRLNEEFISLDGALKNLTQAFISRSCTCASCTCDNPPDPSPAGPNNTPGLSSNPVMDPSGYVYEAVPSNRVQGVRAEVYEYTYAVDEFGVLADEKSEVFWDAKDYDQTNPQVTNAEGYFGWDVPDGQWLVRFSKEGYYDTDTREDPAVDGEGYLPVPPVQTNVNTAIISKASPVVESVQAFPGQVLISFSQYMKPETVTADHIKVESGGKAVKGAIKALNEEKDYEGVHSYASLYAFVPEKALSGTVTVSIQGAENYTGKALSSSWQQERKVEPAPESMTITVADQVLYQEEADLTIQILPKEAGAGKTILVSSNMPSILSLSSDALVADGNGQVSVKVHGNLPGEARITAVLEGTLLEEEKKVMVSMPDMVPEPTHEVPTVKLARTASLKVKNTASGVKLSWSACENARNYKVWRKQGNTLKALGKTRKLTFLDKTAANGKSYLYYVQALGYKTQEVVYKTGKKSTGKAITFLKAPASLSAASKKTKRATLTWKKNGKATGYEIRYSLKSSMKSSALVKVKGKAKVTTTISKLTKGKKYYFQIRSYKTVAGKTYRSTWSAKVKVKIK